LQLLFRAIELVAPELNLVFLVEIDALRIVRSLLGQVVGYLEISVAARSSRACGDSAQANSRLAAERQLLDGPMRSGSKLIRRPPPATQRRRTKGNTSESDRAAERR